MKDRLDKLLQIKSIVTIILTLVFSYLCLFGVVQPELFIPIYTTIIGFYFGTKAKEV